jgi:hypothetical protein
MKIVLNTYHTRSFDVLDIHANMEFGCIKHEMLPATMSLNPSDDHVGDVKQSMRTIKERVRADVHGMPFKRLPKLMVIELVRRAVTVMNQFPALDGVSDTLSPLTIMTGKPCPDYNTMKIEFGSYAQVFEDNNPSNTTKARTTGTIALSPTGNKQGVHFFMSLTSGKRSLSRAQRTELPMPNAVIRAVEQRAEEEKQPLIVGGCPLFKWRPDQPMQTDEANEDVTTADGEGNEQGNYDTDPNVWATEANIANAHDATGSWEAYDGVGVEPEVWAAGIDAATQNQLADDMGTTGDEEHDNWPAGDGDDALTDDWPTDNHDETDIELPDLDELGNNEANSTNGAEVTTSWKNRSTDNLEEQGAEPTVPRYGLRADRTRNYSHWLAQQMDASTSGQSYNPQHQLLQTGHEREQAVTGIGPEFVFGHIMTQMTATAGIKKHGQKAVDALLKEFCKLDDKSVFAAVDAGTLSKQQKQAALRAINLIKKQRNGALKGKSCADGRSQRAL